MAKSTPQNAQYRVLIHQAVLDKIDEIRPQYMDRTTFINFQLDNSISLIKPTASGAPPDGAAVLSLINKDINKEEIRNKDVENFVATVKKKTQNYSSGFNDFWKTYQSCPEGLKAKGQSKPKAFEEYKAALSKVDAEDLLRAAQMAVEGQLDGQRRDEFTAPLPDAFRWLKDGKWEVLLESHTPAKTREPLHPAYRDASDVLRENEQLAQRNIEELRRKAQEKRELENSNGLSQFLGEVF